MKAEIISVSNDVLNGTVRDQNVTFLAKELSNLGFEINRSHFVKAAKEILLEALAQAEKRAEVLVVVGGLGPSADDITKQTVSEHVKIPLVLDQITEEKIITYHKNSDLTMPENNQLQALVIQDSTPIRNETGLAAGMFFEHQGTTYILLPGPFDEMKPTYYETAQPLIIEKLLKRSQIVTKYLRLFGISEASLKDTLKEFVQYEDSPFIGVYKKGEEFEVKITVRSENKDEAEEKAEALKEDILQRVGDYVYAEESVSLLKTVKDLLDENDLTITAAESLTGGEFLSSFSTQTEASSVLDGGIVTYSTEVKNDVLGVPKEITDEFGVVSPQCAIEMAERSRDMFGADVGVSLTGVAGPSSLEGEIPGTVWIGIAKEGIESFAKEFHFAYKRNKNRSLSVFTALDLVRRVILNEEIEDAVLMDDEIHDEISPEELQ
jgi:nicotinamide-nucleotide amidase